MHSDNEENLVDEGAEDFKPSEPQSKAEARGLKQHLPLITLFLGSWLSFKNDYSSLSYTYIILLKSLGTVLQICLLYYFSCSIVLCSGREIV